MAAHLARLFVLASPLLWAACQTTPPPQVRTQQTPERQFILAGLKIEERYDGKVLWSGTGRRADGDLSIADVSDVVLTRQPQQPHETEFTVQSPNCHLAFDAGTARFLEVRISDPSGGLLTASQADYNQTGGTLVGEGPIEFATPSLQVHAINATVWLKQGMVELAGPVEGRFSSEGTQL